VTDDAPPIALGESTPLREREAIIAWLRSEPLQDVCMLTVEARLAVALLASRIERGEHLLK